jgi:endo-1,4-beta-xylanase
MMLALGSLMLGSCADNDPLEFAVTQPDSLSNLVYLQSYDVLKNYVDLTSTPNFLLGDAVTTSGFANSDINFRTAITNFDMVEPKTEFNHGSLTSNSGLLDSTTVLEFCQTASDNGVKVFGHSLISNFNQNALYLNNAIGPTAVVTGEGDVENAYCFKCTITEQKNPWETQALFNFPDQPAVEVGSDYELEFMIKGTVEGSFTVSSFTDWAGEDFSNQATVTTSWQKTTVTLHNTKVTTLKSVIFQLGAYVGTLYVDDMCLYKLDSDGSRGKNLNVTNSNFDDAAQTASSWTTFGWSNSAFSEYGVSEAGEGYVAGITYIEKTEEEKAQIIDSLMNDHIQKMMYYTNGYTVGWDVINEPVDPDDPSSIRTGEYVDEQADDEFYWQDYIGDNWAVNAFKYARQYGGDSQKYFVNESDLLGNTEKTQTLIDFVNDIDAMGGTVDGIGVELHLNINDVTQSDVDALFQKLAATGKLVRISALDVSMGSGVTASSATDTLMKKQADVYQMVIESYKTNVPAAQQFGITLTNTIDTSASPVGIWNTSYSRKRSYGGVADGLAN